MVKKLINDYPNYETVQSQFENKLMKVGYFNHLLCPDLLKIKIERSDYAHIVKSNMTFPKNLHDRLPSSVENIQYHLNFTKLSSSPTDIKDWI